MSKVTIKIPASPHARIGDPWSVVSGGITYTGVHTSETMKGCIMTIDTHPTCQHTYVRDLLTFALWIFIWLLGILAAYCLSCRLLCKPDDFTFIIQQLLNFDAIHRWLSVFTN